MREHIMAISNIAVKTRALGTSLLEEYLVHCVLNFLPPHFGPLKMSYDTQKARWTLKELSSMYSYKEERLRKEVVESVHIVKSGPTMKDSFKKKFSPNNFQFK